MENEWILVLKRGCPELVSDLLSDSIENPSMLSLRRNGPELIIFWDVSVKTCIEK